MELDTRQRKALLIGALIGAAMGAGTGWLLVQSRPEEEGREPIRPLDIFKLVRNLAGLLRELDELRLRI